MGKFQSQYDSSFDINTLVIESTFKVALVVDKFNYYS